MIISLPSSFSNVGAQYDRVSISFRTSLFLKMFYPATTVCLLEAFLFLFRHLCPNKAARLTLSLRAARKNPSSRFLSEAYQWSLRPLLLSRRVICSAIHAEAEDLSAVTVDVACSSSALRSVVSFQSIRHEDLRRVHPPRRTLEKSHGNPSPAPTSVKTSKARELSPTRAVP